MYNTWTHLPAKCRRFFPLSTKGFFLKKTKLYQHKEGDGSDPLHFSSDPFPQIPAGGGVGLLAVVGHIG